MDKEKRANDAVKAESGNRPVAVEVEEDIEKLPPERLLSGGEKIFECLAMSGVEIVSQPPTLRKRICVFSCYCFLYVY